MADEIERLTATLEADISKFSKGMEAAQKLFDQKASAIERRQDDLQNVFSSGLGKLAATAAGLFSVDLFANAIKGAFDAATAIKNTAEEAGLTTTRLQELRYAGLQTGASFETVDKAVITFSKNLGELLSTGAGPAQQAFTQLGIKSRIVSGELRTQNQILDATVDSLGNVGNQATRTAFQAELFGKEAGPRLTGFVNAGSAAIARFAAVGKSLGFVLDDSMIKSMDEANTRFDALIQTIGVQGVAAVAQFAPQIEDLAGRILAGLPTLVEWVDKWGQWFGLIKGNPLEELNKQISLAENGLVPGSIQNDTPGASADRAAQLQELYRQRAALVAGSFQDENESDLGPAPAPKPPALKVNDIAAHAKMLAESAKMASDADAFFKNMQRLEQQSDEALAKSVTGATEAAGAVLAARDQLNVQLLSGTVEYYDAVRTQAQDDANSQVAIVKARVAQELIELNKLKEANGSETAEMTQTRVNDEKAAADQITAIQIDLKTKLAQIDEEQTHRLQDQIQVADAVRSGLEDIGVAALKGGDAFKQAISNMLSSVAELILRLYVLKPLIESVLGPSGTVPGGGADPGAPAGGAAVQTGIGAVLSAIAKSFVGGFAKGGTIPSGKWGIVGENGPEPVVGGPGGLGVLPNSMMSSLPNAAGGARSMAVTVVQNISLAGAVDAQSLKGYMDQAASHAAVVAVATVKRGFPNMMVDAQKRKL